MIELERTFLLKTIPLHLTNYPHKEMVDIYIPPLQSHPNLRIRKNGEIYELTKKVPKNKDNSEFRERTIPLTKEEFTHLSVIEGKKVQKNRYLYIINNRKVDVDIFTGELAGLILIDFEFATVEKKNKFIPPDFCLVEVTENPNLAGGALAGKKYSDIEKLLVEKYHYQPLYLQQ